MTLLLACSAALAQAPLTLDEVLVAVDARVPELASAEAALDEARGKALSARGAFDPKVAGSAKRTTGPYPRAELGAGLVGETLPGFTYEAGWALGVGEFPAYDGYDETGPAGEWRVGVGVPLLDGLGWSEARVAREVADAGVARAEGGLEGRRIAARAEASRLWLEWVAAGLSLGVDQELLDLARRREVGLRREVEEGARAPIELVDNERIVLERVDRLAAAEASLDVAAQSLGLWLRAPDGRPAPPDEGRLPEGFGSPRPPGPAAQDRDLVRARPDVRAADAAIEAARAQLSGARNTLLPDVDVALSAAVPLAGEEEAELAAGVKVGLPTLARKERGALAAAAARVEAREQDRRALDGLDARVAQARARHDAALARLEAARAAEDRAAELWRMETRRFELGDSDLFALWQREEVMGRASKAVIDAELALRQAEVALEGALGVPLAGS